MKFGWKTKKFGDVLDIRNGRNQREVESASGQFPILGSAGKVMGYATEYLCEAGTTIIGRKGTINSPIYVETPFWNVDTAFGLAPKAALDSKFLHYFCLSFDFARLNCGTTIPSLVKTDLLKIEVPLPPLDEQRRIVAVLDKAFAGIATATANAQKNLTNARALFDSYLRTSFDDCEAIGVHHKLSDIMDISHGFAFKGDDFAKSNDDAKPIVLTPGNYTENAELDFSPQRTKRLNSTPPQAFLFKEGDLTLVMTDLSSKMKILGKPAFIDRANILHNQRIGRVIFKNKEVDPRLVYYFLRSEKSLRRIRETATGTMVRHTAPTRILSNVIRVPSSKVEQSLMVARLDGLERNAAELESQYRKKILYISELKQSLLQKAFAGELT